MKFKKRRLKEEGWMVHNQVGETLVELLKIRPTPLFCPPETMKVIDTAIDKYYTMGFNDALTQIRDKLLINELE